MKKIIVTFILLIFVSPAFAKDVESKMPSSFLTKYTQKLRAFGQKVDKTSDEIDAKILEQEKKALEQQKKYEAEKAIRDAKILEQQKARQEAYNATQKRLQEKREQLRILLEE